MVRQGHRWLRALIVKMDTSWIRLILPIASLSWMISCGSSPTANPVPDPTPTLSPTQVIDKAASAMTALKTARFTLEQDGQLAATFFGVELHQIEGEVDMPDKFKIRVEGIPTFLRSFIEIRMIGVGDQASMTNPITGEWNPLPTDALPFDFADLGRTLSGILQSVRNLTFVGTETLDGVPSWRVKGTIPSEALAPLAPGADPGFEVGLEGWIGQSQGLVRKVRIEGQIFSGDNPDVVRVLTIYSFDEPVEISLPSGLD